MWKEYLTSFFNNNRAKCICTFIGLLFSVFVLIIGFFKTVFIVLCIIAGYYTGKKIDNNESITESIREFIERILPNGWK